MIVFPATPGPSGGRFDGHSSRRLSGHLTRPAALTQPKVLYQFANPDLEALCLKMMAKNPEERFQSYQELIDELEKIARFGLNLSKSHFS